MAVHVAPENVTISGRKSDDEAVLLLSDLKQIARRIRRGVFRKETGLLQHQPRTRPIKGSETSLNSCVYWITREA